MDASFSTDASQVPCSTQSVDAHGNRVYPIQGVHVHFPGKPYSSQFAMMSKILCGLDRKQNCLLESPTGSGKSLALLCACLAWQRREEEYIKQKEKEEELVLKACSTSSADAISVPAVASVLPPPGSPVMIIPSQPSLQPYNPEKNKSAETPKRSRRETKNQTFSDEEDFQPPKRFRILKSPLLKEMTSQRETKQFFVQNPSSISPQVYTVGMSSCHIISPTSRLILPDANTSTSNSERSPLTVNSSHSPMSNNTASSSIANGLPVTSSPSVHPTASGLVTTADTEVLPKVKRSLPKIFFGTRTHKQITQIVRELKKTAYGNCKMTILSSRNRTCIHPHVSRSANKNEECKALLDNTGGVSCSFYHNHSNLNHGTLQCYGYNTGWDLEDLVKIGRKIKACPYFGTRNLMKDANIIFCPYNYLIDPLIRAILDISLNNHIIVLDEAHNIEDSAREAASFTVSQEQLQEAMKDLEEMAQVGFQPESSLVLARLLSSLAQWIARLSSKLTDYQDFNKSCKVFSGPEIVAELTELGAGPAVFHQVKRSIMTVITEEKDPENPYHLTLNSATTMLLRSLSITLTFLYKENLKYMPDYKAVIQKEAYRKTPSEFEVWLNTQRSTQKSKDYSYSFNLWCLNPAVVFSDIQGKIHSLIVTSGTLSPMKSFQSELDVPFPVQLEANHIINKSQIWVGTISHGPSGALLNGCFRHAETFAFQDEIGQLVLQICKVVPHGILCFLPSYGMLQKLTNRWETTGLWEQLMQYKVIVSEPRASERINFDSVMSEFYEAVEDGGEKVFEENQVNGALFLAVCRGKVSEGLDFADNNARAVITVGIPFPNLKDLQVSLKRQYNNQYCTSRHLMSGNDWYETQAFRALNQALGRCIRHRNDWGALIVVDERFQKNHKYILALSKWVRNEVKHYKTFRDVMESLSKFTIAKSNKSPLAHDRTNLQLQPLSEELTSSSVERPNTYNFAENLVCSERSSSPILF
ncbi:Fanconi anemia group J protein homolog isoform X2 [Tachypleus tridentatus]|uniref:Fanconi anemia group J protein homolog isoform X2 n=1 Tax=Tachypleus tridentatus TaxID=6853 RepID=UPI003FCFED9A